MQQWLYVSPAGQQVNVTEAEVPHLIQNGQINPQTLMWREGLPQWVAASSVFASLFPGLGSAVTQPLVSSRAEPASPFSGTVPAQATTAVASDPKPAAAAVEKPVASLIGSTAGETPAARAHTPAATPAAPDPSLIRRLARPLDSRKGWIKFVAIMTIISGILLVPILVGLILIFAGLALLKVGADLERAKAIGDADALENAYKNISKYIYLQGVFMVVYFLITIIAVVLMTLTFATAFIPAMKGGGSGGPEFDFPMPSQPSEELVVPEGASAQ